MRDHSPPNRRKHKAIETMIWILPLAEIVIEEVAEVQNSTLPALIAARVLMRAGTLWSASKRTG